MRVSQNSLKRFLLWHNPSSSSHSNTTNGWSCRLPWTGKWERCVPPTLEISMLAEASVLLCFTGTLNCVSSSEEQARDGWDWEPHYTCCTCGWCRAAWGCHCAPALLQGHTYSLPFSLLEQHVRVATVQINALRKQAWVNALGCYSIITAHNTLWRVWMFHSLNSHHTMFDPSSHQSVTLYFLRSFQKFKALAGFCSTAVLSEDTQSSSPAWSPRNQSTANLLRPISWRPPTSTLCIQIKDIPHALLHGRYK